MPILNTLPARAKAYILGAIYGRIVNAGSYAFALAGRKPGTDENTQGVALGYALAGPSARSLNACRLQVNTCEN